MKKGLQKLEEEIKFIRRKGPLASIGGSAGPINGDMFHWQALFVGPIGSYYEGGLYYLEMIFSEEYPSVPPKVRMRTPIYHPNISSSGKICVDYLNYWKDENNIVGLLNAVYLLLSLTKEPEGGWKGYKDFNLEKTLELKSKANLSQKYDWNDKNWESEKSLEFTIINLEN